MSVSEASPSLFRRLLIKFHLHMMLVTKRAKFLARLGSRHRPSSRTPPNKLPLETVYQWNALVPLDFELVSQYVVSYASGVHVSRAYSPIPLKIRKLGGLEAVEWALVYSVGRQRPGW